MNLVNAIHQKESPNEVELIRKISFMTDEVATLWEGLAKNNSDLSKVWHNKQGEKYRIEYGYSIAPLGKVAVLMRRLGIKSICDLGCGAGIALHALQYHCEDIKVSGFDNEECLVTLANQINECDTFKVKDITKLVMGDISEDTLVYFYEPIYEFSLCEKFIDNLCEILKPNQLVYCSNVNQSVGFSHTLLLRNNHMEYYDLGHSSLFKKK